MRFDVRKTRDDLMKQVRSLPPGELALEKLAYLREEIDSAIDDYMNTLNLLSDTAYEDRKHFLLELIQNADDALFLTDRPQIEFVIRPDCLELYYNEIGFSIEDVIAITGAGVSTKKNKENLSHSFIGEKGIGFKSVFALASKVEIASPPWHFYLHKDKPIVPKIIRDGDLDNIKGTRLRVFLDKPELVQIVAEELLRFVQGQIESFLFLQKLAGFVVIDMRKKPHKNYELILDPANREEDHLCLSAEPGEHIREYALYKENAEFNDELVKERWDKLNFNEEFLSRKIVVAALIDTTEENMPEGRLFCFLPTEVKLPIPIFLQVDGHTVASREKLHDPESNNWNKYLLSLLPEFLLRAILSWREDEQLSKILINFIPADSGSDQLAPTFQKLIDELKDAPWVLAQSENQINWTKPSKALIATDFWAKLFKAYPDLREKAESILNKRFVYFEWAEHKSWKDKLLVYGVGELTEEEAIRILEQVNFPETLLKDTKQLTKLYKYLLQLPSLRSDRRVDNNIKQRLLSAKIFPLEGGSFAALHDAANGYALAHKAFWLAGRSTRKTGMEGIVDSIIVDTEYTRSIETGGTITEERKREVELLNERNNSVRRVLQKLGIQELNEDTLLTDLQLPWLCSEPDIYKTTSNEDRFNVLSAIFEVFRVKRTLADEYLNKLAMLKNAYLMSDNRRFHTLNSLLLPNSLKIEPADDLYKQSGLESLYLPSDLFDNIREKDKKKKLKEDWRAFLIACGIRSSPTYDYATMLYQNHYDFKSRSRSLHKLWTDRIGYEYTPGNDIKLRIVRLDGATAQLINNDKGMRGALAIALYEAWLNQFGNVKLGNQPEHHIYDPLPGFFIVEYFRYHNRRILIEDEKWAGMSRALVPLIDLSGKCNLAGNSYYLTLEDVKFKYTAQLVPLLISSSKQEISQKDGVYQAAYIGTLQVRAFEAADLYKLWTSLDRKSFPIVIKAMIELIESAAIETSGLLLFDNVLGSLRSIYDFKLGREVIENVPLIEEQYGEEGKILGELLGLEHARLVPTYIDLFIELLDPCVLITEEYLNQLIKLLENWHNIANGEKDIVKNELLEVKKIYELEASPVIVFNNLDLSDHLNTIGLRVISLSAENIKIGLHEKAASEIGFILQNDLGVINVSAESSLNQNEVEHFNYYLSEYIHTFDVDEISRLNTCLAQLGNQDGWFSRIRKAGSIHRLIDLKGSVVKINITMPFFDKQRKLFFVNNNIKIEDILAFVLSNFGFSRFKHASQDIKAIAKNKPFVKLRAEGEVEEINRVQSEGKAVSESKTIGTESYTVKTIAQEIEESMVDARQAPLQGQNGENWRTGVEPEIEELLRANISDSIAKSLQDGPALYEKKFRKSQQNIMPSQQLLHDPEVVDPKAFLLAEYEGKCQACATVLPLSSGRKWFEIYRIRERKNEAWWSNRQFNILCLCPNCHALFKHGGGLNLSKIFEEAKLVLEGVAFPQEVDEYGGDFYAIPISYNGKEGRLVVSALHMAFFAALWDTSENVFIPNVDNPEDHRGLSEFKGHVADINIAQFTDFNETQKKSKVDFTDTCFNYVQKHIGKTLIKYSKAIAQTHDGNLKIVCLISRGRDVGKYKEYWFGLRPKQKNFLESNPNSYLALGCELEDLSILIPYANLKEWLEGLSISGNNEQIKHWNITIVHKDGSLFARRKSGYDRVNLDEYLIHGSI